MMESIRNEGGERLSQQGFEETFMPHLHAAHNLARWLLRNGPDAEDSVQEAYLRAYRAFPRFRGGDGKPWLMTIVRNVCYTRIKKARREESPEPFDEEIHSAPGETAAEEAALRKANAETLHRALEKLPAEFREVIVLHDLEDLSYKEIAAVASLPIGTVMSRLARARGKLRAEIAALAAQEPSP